MKRIVTALILSAFITVPAFAAPSEKNAGEKIGVVDLQRAVSESKEGVKARADIAKKTEQLNAELKTLQSDFEKLKESFEKDGTTMKADVRADKERQLQQKGRDLQKRQRDAQEEVKQMEAELLEKLVTKLSLLMGKIGDEGEYTMIIEQGTGVRYHSKKSDITAQLIKKADEAYGK
ncbi:MAG: OmpH family outer membrane protein [Chlorobium sp.]|nr:OmpH family outer membrane protein [Chlorobium sp.]